MILFVFFNDSSPEKIQQNRKNAAYDRRAETSNLNEEETGQVIGGGRNMSGTHTPEVVIFGETMTLITPENSKGIEFIKRGFFR
jgi:hypothetical protein